VPAPRKPDRAPIHRGTGGHDAQEDVSSRSVAEQLSFRWEGVIHVLAEGKTIKEAGSILALSSSTICYHKYKIMKSLGIRTNADLVRLAIKERLFIVQ
jgi:DNA-binding NarL/FixJ family response regulator